MKRTRLRFNFGNEPCQSKRNELAQSFSSPIKRSRPSRDFFFGNDSPNDECESEWSQVETKSNAKSKRARSRPFSSECRSNDEKESEGSQRSSFEFESDDRDFAFAVDSPTVEIESNAKSKNASDSFAVESKSNQRNNVKFANDKSDQYVLFESEGEDDDDDDDSNRDSPTNREPSLEKDERVDSSSSNGRQEKKKKMFGSRYTPYINPMFTNKTFYDDKYAEIEEKKKKLKESERQQQTENEHARCMDSIFGIDSSKWPKIDKNNALEDVNAKLAFNEIIKLNGDFIKYHAENTGNLNFYIDGSIDGTCACGKTTLISKIVDSSLPEQEWVSAAGAGIGTKCRLRFQKYSDPTVAANLIGRNTNPLGNVGYAFARINHHIKRRVLMQALSFRDDPCEIQINGEIFDRNDFNCNDWNFIWKMIHNIQDLEKKHGQLSERDVARYCAKFFESNFNRNLYDKLHLPGWCLLLTDSNFRGVQVRIVNRNECNDRERSADPLYFKIQNYFVAFLKTQFPHRFFFVDLNWFRFDEDSERTREEKLEISNLLGELDLKQKMIIDLFLKKVLLQRFIGPLIDNATPEETLYDSVFNLFNYNDDFSRFHALHTIDATNILNGESGLKKTDHLHFLTKSAKRIEQERLVNMAWVTASHVPSLRENHLGE